MRVFLNDYYDTQYEEISLHDMETMLKSCTTEEDVKFFIKHSNDDIGYMELPYNLGRKIISLLTIETIGTINIYPDSHEAYDYGYEICIDL